MFAFENAQTHAKADAIQNVNFNKEMWRKLVFKLKMLMLSTWKLYYIINHERIVHHEISNILRRISNIISRSVAITASKALQGLTWTQNVCRAKCGSSFYRSCTTAMWNFIKMINFNARNNKMNYTDETVVTKSHRSQFLFIEIMLCDSSFLFHPLESIYCINNNLPNGRFRHNNDSTSFSRSKTALVDNV